MLRCGDKFLMKSERDNAINMWWKCKYEKVFAVSTSTNECSGYESKTMAEQIRRDES
jgi:hypothetical protein